MAKVKKAFFCTNCGHQHAQWQGQCSSCKAWNTLQEEVLEKPKTTATWQDSSTPKRQNLCVSKTLPLMLSRGCRLEM
jgi:DNA repair protein RadA/Sms